MGFWTVADGGTTSCRETNERIRKEKTGEGRITHHGIDLSRCMSKAYAIAGWQIVRKGSASERKELDPDGSTGIRHSQLRIFLERLHHHRIHLSYTIAFA